MTTERGFTVVELLVAAAVMLTVTAAVTTLLHDGLVKTPVVEESTDLHQRTRVALDALTADLRSAGAGAEAGTLTAFFAAVVPRGAADPPTSAVDNTVTIRYVPGDGARTRLAAPLLTSDLIMALDPGGSCARNAMACGFTAGTTVAVFDRTGQADIVNVDAIGPLALTISDPYGGRAASYPAGADIVEVSEVSYGLDAGARQLRRGQYGSSFPFLENFTELRFEYLGTTNPPTSPKPPDGIANCLYAADGTPLLPGAILSEAPLVILPLEIFKDGPFCGAGRLMFDLDLLRIRAVRARVRLESGVDRLRGSDPRLFARPGTATGSQVIPDAIGSIHVSLRNAGR